MSHFSLYASIYFGNHWEWVLFGLCIAFFVAGFVDSIAGGGGFISTPSLLLTGIPPHLALGTNKFIVIFGNAIASINFILHKKVLWSIVLVGIVFSIIGAYIGSKAVILTSENDLKNIILLLLPIAALLSLVPKKFRQNRIHFNPKDIFISTPFLSFGIGFYDGYFGPGTGSFLIMGFYVILRMELLYASGCAKLINLGSGLGSLIAFVIEGSVIYFLAIPLIICSMIGGYLGSKLALKKGEKVVRFMVMVVFVLMFISLFVQYRF